MTITAFSNRFIFETLPRGFFLRVPFVGQVTFAPTKENEAGVRSLLNRGLTSVDRWRTLVASGEVPGVASIYLKPSSTSW